MIIHRLDAHTIAQARPQLATLLLDAVADGYSLGFLAGLDDQQLDAYWRGVEAEVGAGTRMLLAAERDGAIVGSAQLSLFPQPNAGNRARVETLLVHCTERRQGVCTALLEALEIEALGLRRGLLVMETEAGSGADMLAEKSGYTRVGEIPEYACSPNGHWRAIAIWYKTLFTRARK